MNEIQYCNWSFDECIKPAQKWLVRRDCGDELVLTRGDSRNWKAYQATLVPRPQFAPPSDASKCPKCTKYVNGVNPYDDGETWRK